MGSCLSKQGEAENKKSDPEGAPKSRPKETKGAVKQDVDSNKRKEAEATNQSVLIAAADKPANSKAVSNKSGKDDQKNDGDKKAENHAERDTKETGVADVHHGEKDIPVEVKAVKVEVMPTKAEGLDITDAESKEAQEIPKTATNQSLSEKAAGTPSSKNSADTVTIVSSASPSTPLDKFTTSSSGTPPNTTGDARPVTTFILPQSYQRSPHSTANSTKSITSWVSSLLSSKKQTTHTSTSPAVVSTVTGTPGASKVEKSEDEVAKNAVHSEGSSKATEDVKSAGDATKKEEANVSVELVPEKELIQEDGEKGVHKPKPKPNYHETEIDATDSTETVLQESPKDASLKEPEQNDTSKTVEESSSKSEEKQDKVLTIPSTAPSISEDKAKKGDSVVDSKDASILSEKDVSLNKG